MGVLRVPKTTPQFSGSPEELTGFNIIVVLKAKIYYSKRIQSKISPIKV